MQGRPKGPLSELAALAELGRVLGTGSHLAGALSRVVEHLEEMVGASSVGLWLRDEANAELRTEKCWAWDTFTKPSEVS